MHINRWTGKRLWLPLTLLMLLTACGGGGGAGKLLVWTGAGVAPNSKTAGQPGQLLYVSTDGVTEPLLDIPAEALSVFPCSESATSPDGKHFVFMVNTPGGGRDGGTLYKITDTGKPVELGSVHALSCTGHGTFQYAPDSKRLAYIDYNEPNSNAEYVNGTLRIFNTESSQAGATIENISAFHLGNSAVAMLQFYTSTQNQVDEIAVLMHENNSTAEIATLFASPGCRFNGASITPAGGKLAILVGHRCPNAGTDWQIYTLNRDGGELTLMMTADQTGGYFPNTRTATLLASPNDQRLVFTSADGLARESVSVFSAALNNLAVDQLTTLVSSGGLMPTYAARTFPLPANARPVFSPDRRWWAVVTSDTRTPPAVSVIDLNTAQSPVTAAADARNNTISTLLFAADNSGVFFVTGGRDGAENTLRRLTLADGTVTTLATDTFGTGGSIAPDGSSLALNIWRKATDQRATPYQDLTLVNPADGSVIKTLLVGITYNEDGSVKGRTFAMPLTYRR